MNNPIKAHLALFFANLIYGANYTIAKEVMPAYIKPGGFIVLRVAGALVLFIITIFMMRKSKRLPDKEDFPRLLFCAITGVAVNQLFFFKGLSLTTPINAGIMMVITPVLVIVLSSIFLHERMNIKKISGIVLGIGGASTLIIAKHGFEGLTTAGLGDLYIFLNALSYGLYLVSVKPLMRKYDMITLLSFLFLSGFIFVLPFGYEEISQVEWNTIPQNIWWCILFVVAGTTFLAYILNNYGLKNQTPSVVSAYIYLQPFLAAMIALSIGKDELDSIKIISGIMIISGVYLVSHKKVIREI